MVRLSSLLAALTICFLSMGPAAAQSTVFGDSLFSFNAGQLTPTQDYSLKGLVFAEGHYWVTSSNPPYYDHRLYKISADGSEVVSWTSLATGYHAYSDLAYDGEFLWATDRDHLAQIDPATGTLTGGQIPANFGTYLVAGVTYDPATDHFWVIPQRNAQLQVIHEIDRAGTILNTYANLDSDLTLSLTWDTWSPGGPFLWTVGREEIGFDSRGVVRQFSPALGGFTGVEIETLNRSLYALDVPVGVSFTTDLAPDRATMIVLQAGALLPTDGLDWIVTYDADLQNSPPPAAQLGVTPSSIETQVTEGDTLFVPVYIGNTGTIDLTWDAYVEPTDPSSGGSGELGDVLASIDLTDAVGSTDTTFSGMTFARGHIWATGRSGPDESRLYKIDPSGVLVDSYPIGGLSPFPWSTIASDGDFIYGNDTYTIAVWSIDSTKVVDNILTNSISPSGLTIDPDNEHLYLASGNGAIEVFDRDGDEVRLVVTPYDLEGIAWDDFSPGGPFLWVWVETEGGAASCCEAIQLDPVTGLATGVRFFGEDQGTSPNVPEAATLTRDLVPGTLTLLGLQESADMGYAATTVAYDLDVALAPSWIDLTGATVGSVGPQGTDTLMVAIHGAMADTTTATVLRISSNDLNQPLFAVPVTITMNAAQPVAVEDGGAPTHAFVLEPNYPNPFTSQTHIRFALHEAAEVTLEIFDVRGRRIARIQQAFDPGQHEYVWNGTTTRGQPAASGVYLYTLSVGDVVATRKLMLLR